jgi:hypothetical protein
MKTTNPKTTCSAEELGMMTPQLRQVYDYLMTGRKLSGMVANFTLKTVSLTSRIAELRNKFKLDIKSEWARDEREQRYKRYWVETE